MMGEKQMMGINCDDNYIKAGTWVTKHQTSFNGTCPFILGLGMDSKTAKEVYDRLLYDKVIKKHKALTYPNMSLEEFEILISSQNNIKTMTPKEKNIYIKNILSTNGFNNVEDEKICFAYRVSKDGKEYAVYITKDEQSVYDAIVSSRLQNMGRTLILGENFVAKHVMLASYMNIELFDLLSGRLINTERVKGIANLLLEVEKEIDEINIEKRVLQHLFVNEGLNVGFLPVRIDKQKRIFQLEGVSVSNLIKVNRFVIDFLNDTAKYKEAHLILEAGEVYLLTS